MIWNYHPQPTNRCPEAPDLPFEKIQIESPKTFVGKIQPISPVSPEASYLAEAREIRSSNAKARMAWAQKVEKEIAPQILRGFGFTNIEQGNGRPVDVEAWYQGTHYLIDVKYLAEMPSIIRKLASLIANRGASEVPVSRTRPRKTKEPSSWFQEKTEGGRSTPVGHRRSSG